MNEQLAHFAVVVAPPGGASRVIVNDADVTDVVQGLQLNLVEGQVPVLQLRLKGDGVIEGTGVVATLPAQPILDWLDSIGVEDLENAVMQASDFSTPHGRTMIDVLKQFARDLDAG
jgi:hypothetical protein